MLGGAHFYSFDGQVLEFQGNCTYTLLLRLLMYTLNNTSGINLLWVGVQKERTTDEAYSVKAIHVKVAKDNISIYRREEGAVWVCLSSKMHYNSSFTDSLILPVHL